MCAARPSSEDDLRGQWEAEPRRRRQRAVAVLTTTTTIVAGTIACHEQAARKVEY